MIKIQAEKLRNFSKRVFHAVGLNHEDGCCISEILLDADLRGVHSHGVQNLARYAKGYLKGFIARNVSCPFVKDAGAISIMDGQNGLGLITCNKAMDIAIERGNKYGIGIVGVRNSNHFGAASYYSMKASKQDQIGFCTTNGPAVMAPWGGRESLLSNNPISIAIPCSAGLSIVLDMACSVVAKGRIRLNARNNLPIPEGWANNKAGEPTTDAREALDGSVLPIGGYKGYGLAVINEILSSALTGALFSFEILKSMLGADSELGDFTQTSWRCGHLVGVLDVNKVLPVDEFKTRVEQLYSRIKQSPKAKGYEGIYLPGELENNLKIERLSSGIPLPESTVEILNSLGREIGIEPILS